MKIKHIIIILLLVPALSLRAQSKFIDKYSNMKGVTMVNISKTLLQMMPNMETNGLNIGDIARDLDSILILTSENDNISKKMRADYQTMTQAPGYEELMRVKDDNSRVQFLIKKKSNNKISELIMAVDESPEFVYIRLCGNLSLEKIKELTKK